jgi:hypothetical protein
MDSHDNNDNNVGDLSGDDLGGDDLEERSEESRSEGSLREFIVSDDTSDADIAETEDTIVPGVVDAAHALLVEQLMQRDTEAGPRRSLRVSRAPVTYQDVHYESLVLGDDCSSDIGDDPGALSASDDDEEFTCATESDNDTNVSTHIHDGDGDGDHDGDHDDDER